MPDLLDLYGKPYVSSTCYEKSNSCSGPTATIVEWEKLFQHMSAHGPAKRWRVGYCAKHTEVRKSLAKKHLDWKFTFEPFDPRPDVESESWDE